MIPIAFYGLMLIILVIGWPFLLLIWSLSLPLVIFLFVISFLLLILVWHYCSSPSVSFMDGIHIISSRLSSGCMNITILYLPAFLLFVYLVFVIFTFIGIRKGRIYTQNKWNNFIMRFVNKKPINDVGE